MTVYRTPHEKRPILNLATGLILAIVLALLALLLGIPAFLSTGWGQSKIIEYVNQQIPGKVAAENMHFSWFGPQEITDFTLTDPQGRTVIKGEKISAESPLWQFVRKEINMGTMRNLNAQLLVSGTGDSNLQIALGLIPEMDTPITTVQLQNVNATLNENKVFTVAGKTQVNKTPGEFAFEMNQGVWNGHVDNFPVDLIQQVSGIADLKKNIGETVDLEIEQKLTAEKRLIEGKIESSALQATLKGEFEITDPRHGMGTVILHQFKLASLPEIEIKEIELPWKLSGDDLQFGLQGSVGHGRLQGSGTLHNWETFQGNFNLAAIPTAFVEKLAGTEGLAALLGPSIDLKADVNSLEKVDLTLRGDQWNSQVILINDAGWKLKEPAVARLTLTPQRFNVIRSWMKKGGEGKFSLEAPAQMQLKIDQIALPAQGHWTQGALDGKLAIDQLTVMDNKTKTVIRFHTIEGSLSTPNLGKEVRFNLQGKQISEQGQESDLHLKGTLQDGWLQNGKFNQERFSLNGSAQFHHLPAGMLCEILCLEELTRARMEAVFGPTVNGTLQAQLRALQGPVQVSVAGASGSIALDGLLNKGYLTLRTPFHLQLTPSPELGESVLQELLPILNDMVRGDQKIQLTIDPQGFSLPLRNPTLETIQIGLLTLSLGRLEFENGGQMGKIISLIRQSADPIIPVWFTPIYLSVQNGIVQVQRFDMLALDHFPLALWGSIDIPDDKIDMVVGLSGSALQSAFKVPVPELDYMMQFPLRGKIGSASIDKRRAAARIAALTAAAAGGPHGLVLGAVLGLASGVFTDPKPPAPTTSPLPWAGAQAQGQEQGQGEGRARNPVESLGKGFRKLFSQ